jgi:UDP-glucose 4-epimerase
METGERPTILVTGASGFMGRHVVPALKREGWAVRRAVRKLTGGDDEVLIESIGPQTEWQAALDGVEAVIHLAARVHRLNDAKAAELYHDVNIEGTLHLARCAADAGVRRFVFISTVLVHGRTNNGRAPFREDDILTPRGVYGMSKAVAEIGLKALAENSDMRVIVIRPPLVYGARAKGNFNLLVKAIKFSLPLPFAAIRNHRAVLSVENLTSFIVQRLAQPNAKDFDVFLLADQEQVSTPEFIERLARAAGSRSRLFPIPMFLLKALLKIGGRPDAHDGLVGSLELDLSKAAATGWKPQFTLDEGLRLATRDKWER